MTNKPIDYFNAANDDSFVDGINNMKLDKPKNQGECTNCLLKDERIAYLERLVRTMES